MLRRLRYAFVAYYLAFIFYHRTRLRRLLFLRQLRMQSLACAGWKHDLADTVTDTAGRLARRRFSANDYKTADAAASAAASVDAASVAWRPTASCVKKVESCNFLTDICNFSTEAIMSAKHLNFAFKFI